MFRSPKKAKREENILTVRNALDLSASTTKELAASFQNMFNVFFSFSKNKLKVRVDHCAVVRGYYDRHERAVSMRFEVRKDDETVTNKELLGPFLTATERNWYISSEPIRNAMCFIERRILNFLHFTRSDSCISDNGIFFSYEFKLKAFENLLLADLELSTLNDKVKNAKSNFVELQRKWDRDVASIHVAVDPLIIKYNDEILRAKKLTSMIERSIIRKKENIKQILEAAKKEDLKEEHNALSEILNSNSARIAELEAATGFKIL